MYIWTGRPERLVELCRNIIARSPGTLPFTRAFLVLALTMAGSTEEAVAASQGLLMAADASDNPRVISFALLQYGYTYRDVDPIGAFEALRRGLTIAHDSGNRQIESHLAASLARHAADSFTLTANPELNTAITHLREVLGDEVYESFARAGESMTNAAMATYAFDQIDQARAHLT